MKYRDKWCPQHVPRFFSSSHLQSYKAKINRNKRKIGSSDIRELRTSDVNLYLLFQTAIQNMMFFAAASKTGCRGGCGVGAATDMLDLLHPQPDTLNKQGELIALNRQGTHTTADT